MRKSGKFGRECTKLGWEPRVVESTPTVVPPYTLNISRGLFLLSEFKDNQLRLQQLEIKDVSVEELPKFEYNQVALNPLTEDDISIMNSSEFILSTMDPYHSFYADSFSRFENGEIQSADFEADVKLIGPNRLETQADFGRIMFRDNQAVIALLKSTKVSLSGIKELRDLLADMAKIMYAKTRRCEFDPSTVSQRAKDQVKTFEKTR